MRMIPPRFSMRTVSFDSSRKFVRFLSSHVWKTSGGIRLHPIRKNPSKGVRNLLVPEVLSSEENNVSEETAVFCRSQFRQGIMRSILKSKRRRE